MNIFTRLTAASVLLSVSVPSVVARVYPREFMVPDMSWSWSDTGMPADDSVMDEGLGEDVATENDAPTGSLTRGAFIDALVWQIYDPADVAGCLLQKPFAPTEPSVPHYLFRDVPVMDAQMQYTRYARVVCMGLKNSWLDGNADGMLHADRMMTVAEAAAVLSRIYLPVRETKRNEAWFTRYMEAIRAADSSFPAKPGDVITGAQMMRTLEVLNGTEM